MTIKSNEELSQAIDKIIEDNGIKKTWLSDKMGIANQNLKKAIHKQNISLDDANKILNSIGYQAIITIQKEL